MIPHDETSGDETGLAARIRDGAILANKAVVAVALLSGLVQIVSRGALDRTALTQLVSRGGMKPGSTGSAAERPRTAAPPARPVPVDQGGLTSLPSKVSSKPEERALERKRAADFQSR